MKNGWRRQAQRGWIGLVCAAFLWAIGSLSAGADTTTLAEIVPTTTLAYIQGADFAAQMDGFHHSALYPIRKLPAMDNFLQDLYKQHEEFVQLVSQHGKIAPEYVNALFDAQFSVALLGLKPGAENTVESSYVIGLTLKAPLNEKVVFDAISAVFQDLHKARQANAASSDGFSLGKIVWKENPIGSHQVLMALSDPPFRFVLLDNLLLYYRGDREGLEELVRNYDNVLAAHSLARNPVFINVAESTGVQPGMSFCYLNTARIYGLLSALSVPRITQVLHALGLDAVKALGGASGFAKDNSAYLDGVRQSFYVYAPGERRGILRALSPIPNPRSEMAAMVLPADTRGMLAMRADPALLYQEVPRLIDAVRGALHLQTEATAGYLGEKKAMGSLLTGELLATLGDALIVQPGPAGMVLRFDNTSEVEFLSAVGRIEQALGASFSKQTVTTPAGAYEISYLNRTGFPMPAAPSFCLHSRKKDGRAVLYLATHPQAIRAVLEQSISATLQQAQDYQRVMRGMGEGYGVFLYLNNKDAYARVYDSLLPFMNVWTSAPFFAADPGKLPYGKQIDPYFFGCGIGIRTDTKGVTFTAYGPLGIGGGVISLLDTMVLSNPASLGMIAAEASSWLGGTPGTAGAATTPPPSAFDTMDTVPGIAP